MGKVTAATRVCFMVGYPADKARTPALFNEWTSRTGRDVVMTGLSVSPLGLPALFAAMRYWESCVGAIVTYPHKQAAYLALDEVDEVAGFNEACNVVRRTADGRLIGTMTDGLGCVTAMEKNGAQLGGADFLLIGAGGAGSAIAYEAARRGTRRITVLDIDIDRRDALVARLARAFPDLTVGASMSADFQFDIACNATPLGMTGETALPYPVEAFGAHTLVVDVVPSPPITPWLEAARRQGLRIQTGPEMVASQFGHVVSHLLEMPAEEVERERPAPAAD